MALTAPRGPGLVLDSLAYVGGAESLAHHGTLRVPYAPWSSADSTAPLAHWPPGMPAAIAIPILVGAAPLTAARIVLAASAFVTVAATLLLVGEIAGTITGVLAALAVMATPAIVQLHVAVWSEPLFLALLVVLLAALVVAPDRTLLAGVLAAVAVMVRYAAVSLTAAVVIWALLRERDARRRLRAAALAALPTIVLLGTWLLHTSRVRGEVRTAGLYTEGFGDTLREGWLTIVQWSVPFGVRGRMRLVLALALLVAVACLLVAAVRRLRGGSERGTVCSPRSPLPEGRLYAAAGLIAICYAVVVVLSRLGADRWIPFSYRLLAPLFVLAEVVVAVALAGWIHERRQSPRRLVAALAVAWITLSLLVSSLRSFNFMRTGLYFGEARWTESELMRWVRTSGRAYALYSNWPTPIYFHAGRPARELPTAANADTLRALDSALVANHGALVVINASAPWQVPADSLIRALRLMPIADFGEGSVWVPPAPPR